HFVDYIHYDPYTQESLFELIEFSSNFDHFLKRLLQKGYDIAGTLADSTSRHQYGRCWHLLNPDTKEKYGVLWDYPGQYASLSFCPRQGECFQHFATFTMYESSEFLVGFKAFQQ